MGIYRVSVGASGGSLQSHAYFDSRDAAERYVEVCEAEGLSCERSGPCSAPWQHARSPRSKADVIKLLQRWGGGPTLHQPDTRETGHA